MKPATCMDLTPVAQTVGLPYRRLPACEGWRAQLTFERPADRRSAIQQTSGLRYA